MFIPKLKELAEEGFVILHQMIFQSNLGLENEDQEFVSQKVRNQKKVSLVMKALLLAGKELREGTIPVMSFPAEIEIPIAFIILEEINQLSKGFKLQAVIVSIKKKVI